MNLVECYDDVTLIDDASGATPNRGFDESNVFCCWSNGVLIGRASLMSDSLIDERRWIPLPVRRTGAWNGRRQLASINPGVLLLRLRLTKIWKKKKWSRIYDWFCWLFTLLY